MSTGVASTANRTGRPISRFRWSGASPSRSHPRGMRQDRLPCLPLREASPSAMTTTHSPKDFDHDAVRSLREDLALALRAAAHHGLAEGVCNHFSIELPDGSGRFLLNPRGLLWSEVGGDDIVMVDGAGQRLAGRHAVEPTAMFIHAAIHR